MDLNSKMDKQMEFRDGQRDMMRVFIQSEEIG
jgi:hypothetical protein